MKIETCETCKGEGCVPCNICNGTKRMRSWYDHSSYYMVDCECITRYGGNGTSRCYPCTGHGKIITIEESDVFELHARYRNADIPAFIKDTRDPFDFSMAMAAVCHRLGDPQGTEWWLRAAVRNTGRTVERGSCVCDTREWIVKAANHYDCLHLANDICTSTICPSYSTMRVVGLRAQPNPKCTAATPEFDRHRTYLYDQAIRFLTGFRYYSDTFAEPITTLLA